MAAEFDHDVLVIGSGASGGITAWNLARQGAKVLILDAGSKFNRGDFWTHVSPWQAHEMRRQGKRPPQFLLSTQEQPYEWEDDRYFDLWRVWGIGGKTNIWGRVSLRYSDLNFSEPERDGWEVAWPFTYDDIAPYYDKVDQLIGVCGGDDNEPWLPGSSHHMPPPNPRCGEMLLKKAATRIGHKIVAGRRAVITRDHRGFAACHYCGSCGKGCDTGSFFNSADHLLPEAVESGNLKIVENAVVARVLVNDEGLASGVQYFDRYTGKERVVSAKRVVVAASCVDSTRILLNSKSRQYPAGIGNGSGVIGRYLCEQVRFHLQGFAPELTGREASNDDGISGGHIYLPRFDRPGDRKDYLRGFGVQLWGIGCQDNADFAKKLPGFGSDFKTAVKNRYPALVQLHPYGEVLPRASNRITVEGTPTDRYGVPIPRIIYDIGDNERKMIDKMYDTAEEILHEMKAEALPYKRGEIDQLGSAIHEHGTCRMGKDPKRSALNGFCQMHEIKNVFVVDGSAFPTATEKNPTLTILATAWRASDYLAEQMRKGDV